MQIDVIGLGITQPVQLSEPAIHALAASEQVIGSPRQLQLVANYTVINSEILFENLVQFTNRIDSLIKQNVQRVAVLASGDPLWFGIGRWLNQLASDRPETISLVFHPNISSLQAACHRLGLALDTLQTISVHGRPLSRLRSLLRPHQQALLLTDSHSTPNAIAQQLNAIGFTSARITVLERLGYTDERITSYTVAQLCQTPVDFDSLLVCLVTTGDNHHQPARWPTFPGFDDRLFSTDKGIGKGMITKREVRLQILSLLSPTPNDCIWDIGAGCGSVAVELAYWCPHAQIIAIESHAERLHHLTMNQQHFGVSQNLRIVAGKAVDTSTAPLNTLAPANKIFIGGSGGELETLLTDCWQHLPPAGVLVISAVMESTRAIACQFSEQLQRAGTALFDSFQVHISRAESLAGQLCYRPALPVTLFRLQKVTHQPNEVNDE